MPSSSQRELHGAVVTREGDTAGGGDSSGRPGAQGALARAVEVTAEVAAAVGTRERDTATDQAAEVGRTLMMMMSRAAGERRWGRNQLAPGVQSGTPGGAGMTDIPGRIKGFVGKAFPFVRSLFVVLPDDRP